MIDTSKLVPPEEKIREGIRRPHKIPGALYRRFKLHFGFHSLNQYYYRRLGLREYNPDGIDIFAADWDNLIILDGCRYDHFEDCAGNLPGTLSSRVSRGSHTVEWLQSNLPGQNLSDTVYVTASPVFNWQQHLFDELEFKSFHDIVDVWKNAWNEEHGTVLPGDTTEYALKASEEHPNKRLLVHFMQPHYPFIGADISGHIEKSYGENESEGNVWAQIETSLDESKKEEVREAYRDNLRIILPHLEELLTSLPGKTVISADHGNLLGERATPFPKTYWGHPRKVYVDELVKVPWHVYQNGSRKQITVGESMQSDPDAATDEVTSRLGDLGYVPE